MKAIVIREPGDASVLGLQEVDTPQVGASQLLIKVEATGVNRADVLQRRGYYPPPSGESEILGLEIAGVVAEVGSEVTEFQVGDRVFGLVAGGGYAEYAVLESSMAMRTPEGWSSVEAAAVPEVFYTANESLFHLGKACAGESILIHAGGSGVGSAGIQLAKASGVRVITTVGSEEKQRRCEELGADHVVLYHEQDFVTEVKKQTDGKGVSLIQDFVGASYLERNLKALSIEGRLVLVGLLGGAKAELNLGLVIAKRLRILGSIMRSLPLADKVAIKQRFEKQWWNAMQEKTITPVLDKTFPLAEAATAHRYLESSQHFGKVILV